MLTRIQQQERAKRKRNRMKGVYGCQQAKGTQPHRAPTGRPIFRPIPVRFPGDFTSRINDFFALLLGRDQRKILVVKK